MAGRPLRPATRHRLGRPLPHQQADRPRVHPPPKNFPPEAMPPQVVSGISPGFPELSQSGGQVTHVLLTRSPLIPARKRFTVRLACVKHAASVRPEPGSNSPLMIITSRPTVLEYNPGGRQRCQKSHLASRPCTPTGVEGRLPTMCSRHSDHRSTRSAGPRSHGITIRHTLLSSQETDARTTRPGTYVPIGCDPALSGLALFFFFLVLLRLRS